MGVLWLGQVSSFLSSANSRWCQRLSWSYLCIYVCYMVAPMCARDLSQAFSAERWLIYSVQIHIFHSWLSQATCPKYVWQQAKWKARRVQSSKYRHLQMRNLKARLCLRWEQREYLCVKKKRKN